MRVFFSTSRTAYWLIKLLLVTLYYSDSLLFTLCGSCIISLFIIFLKFFFIFYSLFINLKLNISILTLSFNPTGVLYILKKHKISFFFFFCEKKEFLSQLLFLEINVLETSTRIYVKNMNCIF